MDTSAIIVVIVGTLLFGGFAAWGALYSPRKSDETDNPSK